MGRIHCGAPRTFFIGGSASYFAYVVVLWISLVAPVAAVSSFCETLVLFAFGLGMLALKEKMTRFKISIILPIFCRVIISNKA